MKTRILCFVLIAFNLNSFSQQKPIVLEGAWRNVQRQSITDGKVVTDFPGKLSVDGIKVWTGNIFMEIAQTKMDTTVSDQYVVGTFKLKGNKYEENIIHIFYKPWEGKTVKLKIELKNDTLIQTYPVDENGLPDKKGAWIEKYVKMDAKHHYLFEHFQNTSKINAGWGLVGSATKNGWNGPDVTFTEDKNMKGVWVLNDVKLSDGEIKFRFNNDWTSNLGKDKDGKLNFDSENISVKAGTYDMKLDLTDYQNPKCNILGK